MWRWWVRGKREKSHEEGRDREGWRFGSDTVVDKEMAWVKRSDRRRSGEGVCAG